MKDQLLAEIIQYTYQEKYVDPPDDATPFIINDSLLLDVDRNNKLYVKDIHVRDCRNSVFELYSSINDPGLSLDKFYVILEQGILNGENKFDGIIKKVKLLKNKSFSLYNILYGVKLENNIQIGQYTLIESSTLLSHMSQDKCYCYDLENMKHNIQDLSSIKNTCLIHISIEAKDIEAAKELANKKFSLFIYVLRFVIGVRGSWISIGLTDNRHPRGTHSIILHDNGIIRQFESKPLLPVPLSEERMFKHIKYLRIWELLNGSKSKINLRLINAITWIGMAIDEVDSSIAFVEIIFAIEGLLKVDTSDFITPSISSQISEYAAFIIGIDKQDRIRLAKQFKKLYSLRSKIAHGYSIDVDINTNVNMALDLARKIILNLLNNPLYQNIKKFSDLSSIITDLKFE